MRFRVVLFLAIGIWFVSAGFGAPADPPLSGTWHAVFEDEFEGSALDNTKWKLVEHWGNMNSGAQPHPDCKSALS